MLKYSLIVSIALATVAAPMPVGAQSSTGYRLSLSVPVVCQVRHDASGAGFNGAAYNLGQLNEYCNAPAGYELRVSYAPGALEGMVLVLGSRNLVLDGSGQAIMSGADMPNIQQRPLVAIPSEVGFNTDRLEFEILPR